MKQPNRPKTDNLSWIWAIFFPKKSKPIPKPASTPVNSPVTAFQPMSSVSVTGSTARPAWVKSPAVTKSAPIFQPGKLFPAFWTVASLLSFVVNVILIVVLISLGQELFTLKRMIGNNLVGGLYENFILMDQAHIKTNIAVANDVPVNFNLSISQDTIVTLTQPTRINGAMVNLNSGGLAINSPANITLPAGTNLPVHLELTVPVNTTIPITINVPVDIPLQDTELHKPFAGLQQVVGPYYWLLQPGIDSPDKMPACQDQFSWLCGLYFR
jgi:hypothetical protein